VRKDRTGRKFVDHRGRTSMEKKGKKGGRKTSLDKKHRGLSAKE